MQAITLTCEDGESIVAHQFVPTGTSKAAVVISAAMGVPQSYYFELANWLKEQKFLTITFDYRGMGKSKLRHLSEYRKDILVWARQDMTAALKLALDTRLDVVWLGHSLGGQVFPLVKQIDQVKKIITVASGSGYWKLNAPPLRRKSLIVWYVIVPFLLSFHSYFPGKKWGIVGDLPKPVMLQWRRWCLNRDYCVAVEGKDVKQDFDAVKLPIKSIALQDDEMLSIEAVRTLLDLFGSEHKNLIIANPQNYGLKAIRHLGFFKPIGQQRLWPELLLPLLNDLE